MNNKIGIALYIFLIGISGNMLSQDQGILFTNAVIHCGNGTVLTNGVMGIRNGKIELLGDSRKIKYDSRAFSQVEDLGGHHIYPGFIAMNSTIGLREIDAVRATLDMSETGDLNPHVRSLPAFNTDSKIIPTVRSNGVFMVQAVPQRGTISGSSSVFKLEGWNWEDALVKADEGIHINWPEYPTRRNESDSLKNNKTRARQQELIYFLEEAKAYAKQSNPVEKNLRFEALKGVFNGTQTVYLHCDKVRDITDGVNMLNGLGIERLVLVGGAESYLCTQLLNSKKIPVVLSRIHRLPDYPDQEIDLPYRLPSILADSGIKVCLSYDGDMEAMGTRNLGFTAGNAVGFGLNPEEALRMITLNPAEVLGIAAESGSLQQGKSATFFISAGDALDMRTSRLIKAFLNGKLLDLNNHQQELYRKYSKKYGLPDDEKP